MVSLADFNKPQEQPNKLSEFAGSKTVRTSSVNQATISNIAAHVAVLSPAAALLPVFSAVTNELMNSGKSPTMDFTLGERQTLDATAKLDTVKAGMADPSLSVEDKAKLMQGYTNTQLSGTVQRSLGAQVTTQAAMAPSDPNDNDEVELTRIDTTKSLDEVDEWNGWVQQQANNIRKASTGGAVGSAFDLVEMIIPFMEAGAVSQVRAAMEDQNGLVSVGKTMSLLGESKNDIRTIIAKMPVDKRKEFAAALIKNIQESTGSVTLRPNDLIMMSEVNDYLVSGSYGGDMRLIDNISSLADLTIIGSPLWRGATKFAGLLKGAGAIAADAKAVQRGEAALARVGAEVENIASQAVPRAPLDNIIESIPGVDKLTADEISTLRNEIGLGLDEGVSVEDIISRSSAFDKLNADEIAEARRVLSEENAGSVPPLTDEVVKATDTLVQDHVIDGLRQLDEVPSAIINDVRAAISRITTSTTIRDKNYPKMVMDTVRDAFKRNALPKIDPAQVKSMKKFIDAESSVARRTVRTDVDFSSVSQRVKDVNPSKARAIHAAVVADKTDDAAKALYGTTRTEAIVNDILPEVAEAGGTVRGKVIMDESVPTPDADFIKTKKKAQGDSHLSPDEKAATRNQVKSDFENVVGLVPHRSMSTVGDVPTGVKFDQVFGPKEGGFASARQARDQVKFSLAKYGVKDDEIEVLARDPQGNFSPVETIDETPGEYLVRVKYDYEFSPADTVGYTLTSSNKFWRLFDALPAMFSGKTGGLAQHLIPAVNINDSLLTNAASAVADKSAWYRQGLEQLGNDYAAKFTQLDEYNRNLVTSYIIEANNKGLKFNPATLRGRGMSEGAVDTVRTWKKAQDTLWHFENIDLNKTLRAKGWFRYVDQTGNSDLIVKPVGKGALSRGENVMNEQGKLVKLDDRQLTELYENGGTIAQLRRPMEVEDDVVEHIVVKQNAESSYTRRIRDDDPTLNYRDGHYTVRYKDPYFITKTVSGKGGKTFSRAVATARNRLDAEQLLGRLEATDNVGKYNLRGDVKKNPSDYEDYQWDEIVNSGRTSQRVRGKRLANASGQQTDPAHIHIETPEESLVGAISSLSTRMASRDFLETAKKRWMNQFGNTLGEADAGKFPADVRAIGANSLRGKVSDVVDAKNTWRYIDAMDSGYVNLMDDFSKSFFNYMSDVSGRSKSWAWLEGGLRKAGEFGPTGFARKKAFRMMLALNPLRQIVVQSMQAFPTILATNPLAIPHIAGQMVLLSGFKRGLSAKDMAVWMDKTSRLATGMSVTDAEKMFDAWRMSGFEAAVDANTLIRDDLTKLVRTTMMQKVGGVISIPADIGQKVGFEAGENALMQSVWLSQYDLLRKSGEAIDAEKLEIMNAKVRHLTGNMNKAGELPYNENALSAALQFLQAPHKAFATVVMGHKGLSQSERFRLSALYIMTYGIGANWVTDQVDKIIPDNWPGKGLMKDGFFNMTMNKVVGTLFQTEANTDYSDSLRLLQFPDMFKFWQNIASLELGEAMTASPSASLIFGSNPRVSNFIKELVRPFTVPEARTPEQLEVVGKGFLNMFSGTSNFLKAQYIMEHEQAMSATGNITDYHSSYVDALAKLAGFSSQDEITGFAFSEKAYRMSQKPKEDIKKIIDEASRRLAVRGISTQETEYILGMLGEAQRVYKNDPFYLKLFNEQLVYKASRGESDIFESVLKLAGWSSKSDMQDLLNNSTLDESQKDTIMRAMNLIDKEAE